MWRNPKFYPPEQEAQAPAETGQRLATIPRPKRDGPPDEIRITLDSFNGNPYLAVRVWNQNAQTGGWFPTRKGTSIRLAEVDAFVAALREGQRLAGGAQAPAREAPRSAPSPSSANPARRGRPTPRDTGGELPDPGVCRGGFDDGA